MQVDIARNPDHQRSKRMSILSIDDDNYSEANHTTTKTCQGPISMCCHTQVMTQDEIMQRTREAYHEVR